MRKFSFSYYGNEFTCNVPDVVPTHSMVKVGNLTVPIPDHTRTNLICLQTWYKFKDFCNEKKIVIEDRAYSYLCSELRKFYNW